MLLRTFGGLSIEAKPGGTPIPALGPRRLALLAVVAAAGARGITREKILGILWPETDEESARHTLSQTLYGLRRDTGREWITGSTMLRLDEAVACDIREFQGALDAGRLAHAVSLYHGPFLDGFYLGAAPEFELWVEETRTRLQFALRKALEVLARRAADAGSQEDAGEWWRRLCTIDPLSASYAAGLIKTLIAAGDQAAALRTAHEYEARVHRELDSEPDPIIGELITRLRAQPVAPAALVAAPTVAQPQQLSTAIALHKTGARRNVWLAAALSAAVVTAVAWGFRRPVTEATSSFLAIGSIQSRDSAALSGVLRDMLATNLARIDGIQIVSNSRLLELLPHADDASASAAADAARRAGANEIIEGELGLSRGGWQLTLRRVALRTGVVRQGYTVRAADLYALTDSATAAVARDFHLAPPSGPVATVRTSSPIAYALYEEGLRALYGGDAHAAVRLMDAVLARDSTFAMAAYFGWIASSLISRREDAGRLLVLARRLAARTTERERLLIESTLARIERPITEYLAMATELAARFPHDPDGQIALAYGRGGIGDWSGAAAAFNRAVAIDSISGATGGSYCRVCDAINGLVNTYLWSDSLAAAERSAQRLLVLRPAEGMSWGATLEPLLRQGRRAEAEAAAARVAKMSSVKVDFSPILDRDLIRSGRSDELEARLVQELRSAAAHERTDKPWLLAIALRNQGRLQDAQNLAQFGMLPGNAGQLDGHHDLVTLAIIAFETGHPRAAAQRYLEMAARDRAGSDAVGTRGRNLTWHLTLAATAFAAAGDTAAIRPLADSVQRVGAFSSIGRDLNMHFFLRGLVLQQQNRHAEAVDAFRRAAYSTTDGYTRINLELARSLTVLRRYSEATAVLQSALRGGVDGSNTYITHTELHEALAHVFHAAGQRDSAAVHYAAVEKAWRHADPEFAERYNVARSRARIVR